MKEINGNLFDYPVIVIPTNGIVKSNGKLVMGAGVALEARNKFKDIDKYFGKQVQLFGNIVHYNEYHLHSNIIEIATIVFSFPTKHHYNNNSDLNLIENSTKQLISKVNILKLKEIYLPKVGCGKGNLDWSQVKSLLDKYLDDRFILVIN